MACMKMLLLLALAFLAAHSRSAEAAVKVEPHQVFLRCLSLHSPGSPSLSKVLYYPNNSNYSSVLDISIQNLRFLSPQTPKPQLIFAPLEFSQVRSAIFCAKRHGLEIRTRCGGHDFEGLSYVSHVPFILLDLFNLRSISIDVKSRTAWVQSGTTAGELYYSIGNASKTLGFPGGFWPTVGVSGLISGGGYGPLVRKFGLAADNVLDAVLMDVNGRILDRRGMGEDLFWAIRGGNGASFGVILAWKLRLVEVPEMVTLFNVPKFSEQGALALVQKYQFVASKFPKDLFLALNLRSVTNQTNNRTIRATFVCMYLGGVDNLLSLMNQSFPELGIKRKDCTQRTLIESFLYFRGLPAGTPISVLANRTSPAKFYMKAKSDFIQDPIPLEGLQGIFQRLNEIPPDGADIDFTPFGGIMDEISESALPFPFRGGYNYILFKTAYWNGSPSNPENPGQIEWIRRLQDFMGAYVSKNPRGQYVNYRDLDLGVNGNNSNGGLTSVAQARVWGSKYFKENFDRLVRAKTEIDPANFFKFEQSIPPL